MSEATRVERGTHLLTARISELEHQNAEMAATIEEWRTRAAEYARQLEEARERTATLLKQAQHSFNVQMTDAREEFRKAAKAGIAAAEARAEVAEREAKDAWEQAEEFFNAHQEQKGLVERCRDVLGRLVGRIRTIGTMTCSEADEIPGRSSTASAIYRDVIAHH